MKCEYCSEEIDDVKVPWDKLIFCSESCLTDWYDEK